MVRVVDPGPHHTVVKEVVCRNCGAKLEYVPRDIRSRRYTDYGGGVPDWYMVAHIEHY